MGMGFLSGVIEMFSIQVVVIKPCENTKHRQIVYLKRVNFMVCELQLKKKSGSMKMYAWSQKVYSKGVSDCHCLWDGLPVLAPLLLGLCFSPHVHVASGARMLTQTTMGQWEPAVQSIRLHFSINSTTLRFVGYSYIFCMCKGGRMGELKMLNGSQSRDRSTGLHTVLGTTMCTQVVTHLRGTRPKTRVAKWG